MTRIVERRNGEMVSTEAVEVSAGAADAERIPQLNSSGLLDTSLIPTIGTSKLGGDITTAGKALLDDGDAAAQRTTLGLGSVATLASDADGTLAANSDAKVATQKAVKTYVDTAVTGLLDFKGSTNASTNPNYPAASKGDAYVISVAGKIGGASGKSVDVGDVYLAIADNAGGTEAAVGTSWIVLEHNLQGALLSANNLSDLANAPTARTNLGITTAGDAMVTAASAAAQRALLRNACMASLSADLTAQNYSGFGNIGWTSEVYDDGGWHSTAANTDRMTVPAGVDRVRVGCDLQFNGVTAASTIRVAITKNAATFVGSPGYADATDWTNPLVHINSGPLSVSAGDIFRVQVFCSDTSIDVLSAGSAFWIEAA